MLSSYHRNIIDEGDYEMNYEVMVKHILYEFEVTQKYVAYKYILKGMNLMRENENYVEHITKTLYIDIAKEYNTSVACVERGIRTTIEIMWRNKENNMSLFTDIFGNQYVDYRPTNTKFFQLMYMHIESYNLNEADKKCPFYGCEYCIISRQLKCLKQ